MPTVWQDLTPDSIFSSVENALGAKLSNICLKRNSYINRVYELEREDNAERFVVKFYRPQRWTPETIMEEHRFLLDLAGNEITVIPPLAIGGRTLFMNGEIPFAVFPKKGGRTLDEFDREGWTTIGRILGRVHNIGEGRASARRIRWEPENATREHVAIIFEHEFILPDFKKSLTTASDLFIKVAKPLFTDRKFILLHGDCHKGNLIFRPGEGIYMVDFDDCCIGPAAQDLWLLLPDKVDNSKKELAWFFEGYEVFRKFDRAELELVPALRGMRLLHYAAWLAVQSKEPDFAVNFPEAGKPRYWNELIRELQGIVYEELSTDPING
ncbi:MAG TPA: serine/threonine protein kinase [Candidatus Omnitrophota bacterium]|nr:serine/threonine protein kinase [Candidatus Omnitrophota bacterium]